MPLAPSRYRKSGQAEIYSHKNSEHDAGDMPPFTLYALKFLGNLGLKSAKQKRNASPYQLKANTDNALVIHKAVIIIPSAHTEPISQKQS